MFGWLGTKNAPGFGGTFGSINAIRQGAHKFSMQNICLYPSFSLHISVVVDEEESSIQRSAQV